MDSPEAAPTLPPGPGELVGHFRLDVAAGRWTWSPGMFEIYGYAVGEVEPTTGLVAAHQHPEDSPDVQCVVEDCLRTGAPFGFYHRIVDRGGVTHQVAVGGAGIPGADGQVSALVGFLVDLTGARSAELQQAATQTAQRVREHLPAIERAKGAIMMAYGLDAEAAFELLRWHSQQHNVRLHDIAEQIAARLTAGAGASDDARRRLDGLLAEVAHQDRPRPAP